MLTKWLNRELMLATNFGNPAQMVTKVGSQNFGIRILHNCPLQMNENLLISNSKLTSDSELIWWC